MSAEAPETIYQLVWAVGGAVVAGMATLIWFFIQKLFKEAENKDNKLEVAMIELNHSIMKLTVQMELVLKQLERIPELEKDVAGIGAKVRSMNNQPQGQS